VRERKYRHHLGLLQRRWHRGFSDLRGSLQRDGGTSDDDGEASNNGGVNKCHLLFNGLGRFFELHCGFGESGCIREYHSRTIEQQYWISVG
jgi:hypothetical protein